MVLKEFRPLVSAVGEPSAGRCLHFGNDLDYSTHQEQSQGYTPWQRRAPSKNAVILVPGEEGTRTYESGPRTHAPVDPSQGGCEHRRGAGVVTLGRCLST